MHVDIVDELGGVTMSSITGLCPKCCALRNAHVIAEHEEVLQPTEPDPTAQANAYRILKCAGCDTVYFQRERLEIVDNNPNIFMESEYPGVPVNSFAEFKEILSELREKESEDCDCSEETLYWPTPLLTKVERAGKFLRVHGADQNKNICRPYKAPLISAKSVETDAEQICSG
jgi:hypothetical protein